jgi:hypothetical protein
MNKSRMTPSPQPPEDKPPPYDQQIQPDELPDLSARLKGLKFDPNGTNVSVLLSLFAKQILM